MPVLDPEIRPEVSNLATQVSQAVGDGDIDDVGHREDFDFSQGDLERGLVDGVIVMEVSIQDERIELLVGAGVACALAAALITFFVARMAEQESLAIPVDLDYAALNGLSIEIRQRLSLQRPQTVGQASRIQGVTPAAIAVLLVHLKKLRGRG